MSKCPKCNSENIHVSKQGFGIGKSIIGTLAGGIVVGVVAGAINKDKLYLVCLDCSHKFNIGDKKKSTPEMPVDANEFFIVGGITVVIFSIIGFLLYLIFK